MPKGEDITTRFKVDISDLKKGITEANKNIKLANAEFKAASAGMDNWAKSSEGIKAKLKQLNTELTEQTKKLENYKKQQTELDKAYKENGKRAEELKAKLQDLSNKGVSKTSDEYKKYQKALNDVEKEQNANKKASDDLKITILNQQGAVNKTRKELDDFGDTLRDMDDASNEATSGFTVMKGALSSLVADGIRMAIDAAKEFASTMIDTAAEVKAEASQFKQTFGDMGDEAQAAIGRVAKSTGILDTRLNSAATSIYAFARSSGADTKTAMSLMETSLMAAADGAAYYDRSLEDTTETLQSFLKGNFANDAALGVSCTETTRNAKAMELFGKKYNKLSEVQKQQTLLKMVTDSQKLSGAMGQASREADGWENVQGNLNEAWRQFKADVGTPFLEAIIPVIQEITKSFIEWKDSVDWDAFGKKVEEFANKIIEGFGWIIDNKDTILAALAGIASGFIAFKIAGVITGIVKAFKIFFGVIKAGKGVMAAFNAVFAMNPIGIISVAIGVLIGLIVLLIKNWDTVKEVAIKCWNAIKEACSKAWESIKEAFSKIGEWFTEKFNEAKEGVMNAWNSVGEWFKTKVVDPIKKFFSDVGNAISKFFTDAWNAIVKTWTSVANWFNTKVIEPIKKFFSPLVNWFTQLFTSIWDFIKSVFNVIVVLAKGCVETIKIVWGIVSAWFNTNVVQPVKTFFTNLWNAIKNAAQTAWNFIKSVWIAVSSWFNANIIQPVKNFFTSLWNALKTGAQTAWNGIKSIWQSVSNWFTNTIINPVKNTFTNMWNSLKTGASNAWNGIKSVFSTVASFFENTFRNAWEKVKAVFSTGGKIFDGIKDGIVSAFKNIVNAIIRGINRVVSIPFGAINSALDKIRGFSIAGANPFSGLPSISVPQIPELQYGIAKAKKGHQYLLEGKNDEAVIPLHKNAKWLKGLASNLVDQMSGGVTNNLGGAITNSNVNNFTQNIYAPKAPSRIELYRQTKNLLAYSKGGY